MSSFPLNVAVASAARSPVGRAIKGTLRNTRPDDLAALAMKESLARVEGLEAKDVEDVILGCAFPEAEQGFNVARNAVFIADWPDTVTGACTSRRIVPEPRVGTLTGSRRAEAAAPPHTLR